MIILPFSLFPFLERFSFFEERFRFRSASDAALEPPSARSSRPSGSPATCSPELDDTISQFKKL